jgi:hypothetical protein
MNKSTDEVMTALAAAHSMKTRSAAFSPKPLISPE